MIFVPGTLLGTFTNIISFNSYNNASRWVLVFLFSQMRKVRVRGISNLLKAPHSQLGVEPVLAFVQSASSFDPALDSQFQALCHVQSRIHRSLETVEAALEEFNLNGERSQ